jgi:hypothetical protein
VVSKEVMTAVDSVIAIPVRHFYRSEEDDAAAGALRAVGGEGGDTCVNSVMKTLPRAILRPMVRCGVCTYIHSVLYCIDSMYACWYA